MAADNLRAFPVASGQPQPAYVPYSTFQHVCDERNALRDERDRLRDEVSVLRQWLDPPYMATPDELERGEALITRALAMTYRNDSEEVQRAAWARAFASPAVAALLVYPIAMVDTMQARRQKARGWWTPGRVALVAIALAIVTILVVGR
jgi:hypothetical protein